MARALRNTGTDLILKKFYWIRLLLQFISQGNSRERQQLPPGQTTASDASAFYPGAEKGIRLG